MKKKIMAVVDTESAYAYNFMEYLNQKRNIPFEIQAFTNVENLAKFTREQPVEILLISDQAMNDGVKQLPIRQIIILSEGIMPLNLEEYPSVYKYQSSETVVREVLAYYGERQAKEVVPCMLRNKTRVIGVYSPVGRSMKTSFALSAGQLLAKYKPVLYLNLEEYAGFEDMFQKTYEKNLSDLLYYQRQKEGNLACQMVGMIHSINGLDYLPPVLSPTDLIHTSYEEWEELIHVIQNQSEYEVLIIDVGDGIDDLYNFLDLCDVIYMPLLSDSISKAKVKQFENLLRMWDCIPVLEKIKKIQLERPKMVLPQEHYMEQLVWSEFGRNVKKILEQDKEL
ncbi:MAG: hypothetical protein PHC41_01235 [Lachnospiraceae bacterium]|jgi:cellulose biosynthesis protein BcsQ|nr:hypothetical protein [Lachnospiraceae bacterium]MDD3614830.1 hypothetical protein [Lachnospiraceae bacterium]